MLSASSRSRWVSCRIAAAALAWPRPKTNMAPLRRPVLMTDSPRGARPELRGGIRPRPVEPDPVSTGGGRGESNGRRPRRTELKVTTGPIRGSRKIHVEGRADPVAMRAVDLEPSLGRAAGHALRHQRPLHRPGSAHRHHGRPARAAPRLDPRPRRRRGSRPARGPPRGQRPARPRPQRRRRALPQRPQARAPRQARRQRHARCTTPAAASSRPRWNMSRSARTSAAKPRSNATPRRRGLRRRRSPTSSPPSSSATRSPAAARSSPANINHPETEPMAIGRNFLVKINANIGNSRGRLRRRRRGRQDGLGDPLGRRHGHGPVDRPQHPRHPRMDHPQLARADRHRPDLPGAREGRRRRRGPDLGSLPRHADRAGRAGRRLFHHPRRRAPALRPADRQARHRDRQPRRLDHGQMVPRPPPRELPLRALRRDLRDHEGLRHRLQPRRRPAPRQHRRRQRRGPVRRALHAWAS